jgi:hypothetical protein
MDEDRERLLDAFDARTGATFTVVNSGEVVVSATVGAVSPREKWKPNLTPAARGRAVTGSVNPKHGTRAAGG